MEKKKKKSQDASHCIDEAPGCHFQRLCWSDNNNTKTISMKEEELHVLIILLNSYLTW